MDVQALLSRCDARATSLVRVSAEQAAALDAIQRLTAENTDLEAIYTIVTRMATLVADKRKAPALDQGMVEIASRHLDEAADALGCSGSEFDEVL